MLRYLADYQELFGPLRLFDYVTFRAGGAAFTAMLLVLIFGPATIRRLKKFNTVAPTRLEGLVAGEFIDRTKDKTPSMGGILIIAAITVATMLWATISNPLVVIFLFTLIALGLVGFQDDYTKVFRAKKMGMSGRVKLLLQFLIAVLAVILLDFALGKGNFLRDFMVPFLKKPLVTELPLLVVLAFSALVMVGASNAVNLTDGKDGLASGCMIFCSLTYAVFAYLCGHKIFAGHLNIPFIPGISEVAIFAAAISGACIGFLWYNCHPAAMFMGDTGSLPLGGTIGLIAVLVRQELVLVLVGGVFVMEALSVILQVISFKLTKKRIFLCTPIHHHFEQKKWTETQIVVRFWILAGVCALLGLATLKIR